MRLAVITSKTTMKKEKLKYGWKVEKSPLLVIKTHKRVRRRENLKVGGNWGSFSFSHHLTQT